MNVTTTVPAEHSPAVDAGPAESEAETGSSTPPTVDVSRSVTVVVIVTVVGRDVVSGPTSLLLIMPPIPVVPND